LLAFRDARHRLDFGGIDGDDVEADGLGADTMKMCVAVASVRP
jgi:hypothetical protein